MIDETFLAQHRATLVRDQDGWLLRYPLECRSFSDERLKLPIETTVALVGKTREDRSRSHGSGRSSHFHNRIGHIKVISPSMLQRVSPNGQRSGRRGPLLIA